MVEDDADRSQKWSDMDHSELLSIVTSIKNLPTRDALENAKLIERRREKEIIKRRIHDLWNRSTFLRELIDRRILQVNGIVGEAASSDLLDSLLNEQAYRLSYWRVAAEEINYRRFFDINELAALRTEIPEVLMDTHQLLFELIDEGIIDGLRIDHPDGLLDPHRFNRLVSLKEVGGDPSQFGISVEEFHEFNQARSQKFNHAMNSSSTQDTKRSEDVRARLNVLSEIPRHWKEHVQRWVRWNKSLRTTLSDGTVTPSRNAEYLLYQTIVGTIPLRIESRYEWDQYIDRLQRYMIKVEREAKVEASWVRPDLAYEHALSGFIANLFAEGHKIEFRNDILDFARMVARHGTWNSLSQLVLKMTLPGIPDFYQGTEFGTFTLVDPDNRNAVDWEPRSRCVEAIRSLDLEAIPPQMDDSLRQFGLEQIDLLKCYVSSFGLNFRKQFWQLFQCGDYQSVEVAGFKARGVIAYAREFQGNVIVVTVGRFSAALHGIENLAPIGDMWGDTRILFPKHMRTRSFQNILTGKTTVPHGGIVSVRELFDRLPISILFAGIGA